MSWILTWSICTVTVNFGISCARTGVLNSLLLPEAAVGEAVQWLKEQDVCQVTLWNEDPIAVTTPNFVELEVIDTDPGLKGDTANGGTKPATLSTGATIKGVPLFVNIGDVLKIDTRTGCLCESRKIAVYR